MKSQKSPLQDKDMRGALKALVRASKRARGLAAQTGTPFVVMRNGKLVSEILKPKVKRLN